MRISDWSSDVCSSDLIEARFADILRPQIQIELIVRRDDAEGHNGIIGIEIAVASRIRRREADIADIRPPDEIDRTGQSPDVFRDTREMLIRKMRTGKRIDKLVEAVVNVDLGSG